MTIKSLRPLGDVTCDLEELLFEMAVDHELQLGEILNLIKGWTEIHCPGAIEQYEDDTVPVFLYGHEDYLVAQLERLKRLKGSKK